MSPKTSIFLVLNFIVFALSASTIEVELSECAKKHRQTKALEINDKEDLVKHYNALDSLFSVCKTDDKEWINKVISIAMEKEDSLVGEKFIWSYYLLLYVEERYEEARNLLVDLFEYAEENNFNVSGDYFVEAGLLYSLVGDYAMELSLYDKAVNAYQEKSSDNLTYAYSSLGTLYETVGETEQALAYQLKAYEVSKGMDKDFIRYYNTCNNLLSIANIYAQQGKLKDADEFYRRAIQDGFLQRNTNQVLSCFTDYILFQNRIGKLESIEALISSADSFMKEAIKIKPFKSEFLSYYAYAKSKYAISIGDNNLLMNPDSLLSATLPNDKKKDIFEYAIEYYKSRNNFEKALEYGRLESQLIKEESNQQRLSSMNLIQEKKISNELLKENFALRETTHTRQLSQYFLSFLLIGLGAFFAFTYKSKQKTQKLNSEIAEKNKKITYQLKELERISYVTTHDLKEPANTINSFAKMIDNKYADQLPEKSKELFAVINQTSDSMLTSIELLHSYLLVGATSKLEYIDLNQLLSSAETNLAGMIKTKNARIIKQELPSIYCYGQDVFKLFQSLISNAIKYSKSDEAPLIQIDCVDKGDQYQFSFQDNGIGIDSDSSDEIFDLFKRLHSSADISGSGIGLANSRKIVELHKGKIWVDSKPNIGSTFYFTLNKNLS